MAKPSIFKLKDSVIDQIAAGEVVERPASVVKELMENALDAGATRVSVQIDGGGLSRIEVLDDGHGIAEEDLSLALERHATSKLREVEDLMALQTFGFRGEALSAIASVSRLEISTRTRNQDTALLGKYDDQSGTMRWSKGSSPVGTRLVVRDLFHNVPARLKFQRAESTETSHARDAWTAFALDRPDVAFSFARDGQSAKTLPKVVSFAERAQQIFGKTKLLLVEDKLDGIALRAALSSGADARASAANLYLFVNGRWIRDRGLARSIAFAYGPDLPAGRFPIGTLSLTIDPSKVDVNVHPQKTEVRFSNPAQAFETVSRILAHKLVHRIAPTASDALPAKSSPKSFAKTFRETAPHPKAASKVHVPYSMQSQATKSSTSSQRVADQSKVETRVAGAASPAATPAATPPPAVSPFRVRALFGGQDGRPSCILIEGPDGVFLVPTRTVYTYLHTQRLHAQLRDGCIASKKLLWPTRLTEIAFASNWNEDESTFFQNLGFELVALSATSLALHSVPTDFPQDSSDFVLRKMLSTSMKIEDCLRLIAIECAKADSLDAKTASDALERMRSSSQNAEEFAEVLRKIGHAIPWQMLAPSSPSPEQSP